MTDETLPLAVLAGTAAVFSRGLVQTKHLHEFLGASALSYRPVSPDGIDYVIGWGHKPTIAKAQAFSTRHQLPFIRLEDGFLRSTDPGSAQPPACLVLDPIGIYYDARSPSHLEELIAQGTQDPQLLRRAETLRQRVLNSRISKYNHAPVDSSAAMQTLPASYVLVIDQIASDSSVSLGTKEGQAVFQTMLAVAAKENPDSAIVVKIHPAARSARAGALSSARAKLDQLGHNLIWTSQQVNPHALLKRASKVYVATSQLGFEALLHKKQVICFGAPFYAGWGLTDDRTPIARRTASRSLGELIVSTWLKYSRYVDPVTGRRCEIEDILEHFELQNRQFASNQGRTFCFGFSLWKRRHTRHFLRAPGNEVIFCRSRAHATHLGFNSNCRALAWGQRAGQDIQDLCQSHHVPLERMEDGFLRSVGLGSDLTVPWSLVVDKRGMYYDPRAPSDLETLLSSHCFSQREMERAAILRKSILHSGISKYNASDNCSQTRTAPTQARQILVPGQVETDASVLLGGSDVRTNLELLKRVRSAQPHAYLVFKPHPDVEAGNRPGKLDDALALTYCDEVERVRSIANCLERAEEVHTITSLVGFEALLRGLPVVVYGQPFYSGWGLTEDNATQARRNRTLHLDELVAGALLLYPRYVDAQSGYFCSAEQALDRLIEQRNAARGKRHTLLDSPLTRPVIRTCNYLRRVAEELALGLRQEARRV